MASEVTPASIIMIIITLILLPVLVFMTYKVYQMVWLHEKAVPLMLVALCLTLISLINYFGFLIGSVQNPAWCCDDTSNCSCVSSIVAESPTFFLAIAVILNLNVWVYFKLRINAFIKIGFGEQEKRNKRRGR